MNRIAFIGAGAMGGALIRGLVATGALAAEQIFAADHNQDRQEELRELGVHAFETAEELFCAAGFVDATILAIKPQVLASVLQQNAALLAEHSALVVSIAIGYTIEQLSFLTEEDIAFARMMPNLPVAYGMGAMGFARGKKVKDELAADFVSCFDKLGSCVELREDQVEALGAFTGTAPAFFALFADALTRAGIRAGVPAEQSRQLVLATMEGTAHELRDSALHPRLYMERVCSPGGSTAAALAAMEPRVMEAVDAAVQAALTRAHELSS